MKVMGAINNPRKLEVLLHCAVFTQTPSKWLTELGPELRHLPGLLYPSFRNSLGDIFCVVYNSLQHVRVSCAHLPNRVFTVRCSTLAEWGLTPPCWSL